MSRFVTGDSKRLVWALLLFGALVLGIGCANVGSVQLARAIRRSRELGLRYQLGASRSQLAFMVVRESAWLAALGAFGGLILMVVSSTFLRSHVPVEMLREGPGLGAAAVGTLAITFVIVTLVLALSGGALTAESRALRALRAGRMTPYGSFRAQRSLVAVSACLTVALALGAGLMFRTVRALARQDPGFEVDGLVTIAIAPSVVDADPSRPYWAALVEALGARGDVEAVGAGYNLPLTGHNSMTDFRFVDHPTISREERQLVGFQIASPGYVEALGLRVRRGRPFSDGDGATAPGAVVVNAAFERAFFPRSSILGRRLTTGSGDPVTVVGVVSDTRHSGLDSEPEPRLYFPVAQFAPRALTLVARTGSPVSEMVRATRERLSTLDAYAVITGADRYSNVMVRSMGARARLTEVLWLFAAFGLLISALGLFGTMHGWIAQRRRDVGVRSALGATPARIVRWVVRTGAVPLTIGSAVGAALGMAAARLLSQSLYAVEPWDPVVMSSVIALQLAVGMLAVAHPARMAATTEVSRVLNRTGASSL